MLLDIDGQVIETSELPSLKELRITSGTLEAAEEIAAHSDVPGLERHTLELLVRAVVFADRRARTASSGSGMPKSDHQKWPRTTM